jgi:hypothetical protein
LSLPIKGQAYVFGVGLLDSSNTTLHKTNPTIAAGDFKISKEGGAYANLTNLPAVSVANDIIVISLTASEMDADWLAVRAQDQTSPVEWLQRVLYLTTL